MQVRMITTAAGPEGVWPAGSVQNIDEATAQTLIDGNFAEPIGVPQVREVAAVDPVAEVADAPAQTKPKRRRTRK